MSLFEPSCDIYYSKNQLRRCEMCHSMPYDYPRHSPFSLLTAVSLKICNFSCVENCTVPLYKLLTQLKHHLLRENVNIGLVKVLLLNKSFFFLHISVNTASSVYIYTFWIAEFLLFLLLSIIWHMNHISIFT